MTAHENPLGLDGFEFVEFTSPDPEALADLFEKLVLAEAPLIRRRQEAKDLHREQHEVWPIQTHVPEQ